MKTLTSVAKQRTRTRYTLRKYTEVQPDGLVLKTGNRTLRYSYHALHEFQTLNDRMLFL